MKPNKDRDTFNEHLPDLNFRFKTEKFASFAACFIHLKDAIIPRNM